MIYRESHDLSVRVTSVTNPLVKRMASHPSSLRRFA